MRRFPRDVINQVTQICAALDSGTHWSQLGGRRHIHSNRIVFRLKHWYRLVFWHSCQAPLHFEVMTHEHYNTIAHNNRR